MHMVLTNQRHDQMAGADQCLLVCKGDVLALPDCRDGRNDPDHADDRAEHKVCLLNGCGLDQPLHPGDNPDGCICHFLSELTRVRLVPDRRDARMELPDLFLQFQDVSSCCQGRHLHIVLVSDHIQRLGSDGARTSKDRYRFHLSSSQNGSATKNLPSSCASHPMMNDRLIKNSPEEPSGLSVCRLLLRNLGFPDQNRRTLQRK